MKPRMFVKDYEAEFKFDLSAEKPPHSIAFDFVRNLL